MHVKFKEVEERYWFLFTRYLSKESSLEENEELKDIIAGDQKYKQLFEQNSAIWNGKKKSDPSQFDHEKIKRRVFENIKSEDPVPVTSNHSYLRYAAVMIFMICVGYVAYNFAKKKEPVIEPVTITKSTDDDQRGTFALTDGTKVVLNENSSITYLDDLAHSGERRVQLVGEAYFKVAKNPDLPFVVNTGNVLTRVLGTSFNVRAFPNHDVEVTVETGKVLVESQFKGVALESNQQATVNLETSNILKSSIDSKNVTVWKNTEMEFDMVSLKEAFFIMERYYNVTIITNDQTDLSCTFRSKYENENLETVLQGLKLIFDFDYKILEGNKIKISGAGCKP